MIICFWYSFFILTLNHFLKLYFIYSIQRQTYTNIFVALIDGHKNEVDRIVFKYNFTNYGPIWNGSNYFILIQSKLKQFSSKINRRLYLLLKNDKRIKWFKQQQIRKQIQHRTEHMLSKKGQIENYSKNVASQSINKTHFNDPLFPDQWYINGLNQLKYDINVIEAWKQGFTGNGVVISILDDGIQSNHPDLKRNYDEKASIDLLAALKYEKTHLKVPYKHGTRCAGEIASEANNSICGVGLAYNSKIGGIRMLTRYPIDAIEALALSFNFDYINIFSASWGPFDNGKTLGGPSFLAKMAIERSIQYGRNGLGVIYVWASGNGGRNFDDCNADGYVNSIYVIAVSSCNQYGLKPPYVEECSSILTTTFSSGGRGSNFAGIVTTDLNESEELYNSCTKNAGGTSASAPMLAGVIALALEANSNLTWRDVKHLIVLSSRSKPLKQEIGWYLNGNGLRYNHKFGFGLIDAGQMTRLAHKWKNVDPMVTCTSPLFNQIHDISHISKSKLSLKIGSNKCEKKISYLEHVQISMTILFKPRGNLEIRLNSPKGTISKLLSSRPKDMSRLISNWTFSSVHFWGESPKGEWKLDIINTGLHYVQSAGKLINYRLTFHGY